MYNTLKYVGTTNYSFQKYQQRLRINITIKDLLQGY